MITELILAALTVFVVTGLSVWHRQRQYRREVAERLRRYV